MLNKITLHVLHLFLLLSSITQIIKTQGSSIDYQLCNEHCLKCSSEGLCLFCDVENFFFLNNNTCSLIQIDNCAEYTFRGKCKTCKTNYYLSEEKCKVVDESSRIPNCKYYKNSGLCSECEANFNLLQGDCISIENPIENCTTYDSSGTQCTNCVNNVLSTNFKSCDNVFEKFDNCKFYSLVSCEACKTGYFRYENTFMFQIFDDDKNYVNSLSRLEEDIYSNYYVYQEYSAKNFIMNSTINQCIKIEVSNCSEYESFDKCKVCMNNFFLTPDKECKQYPEEKIQFCSKYKSKDDCEECEPGFYRSAPKECTPVNRIADCKIYDGFLESKCLECESDFYLEDLICKSRLISKSISNCILTSIDRDGCSKCAESYETNSQGSICLPAIQNCKEYIKTNDSLNCSQCDDTYFLSSNKCSLGSIQGCKVYENENRCQECQQSYYLDSFICSLHTLTTELGCSDFSVLSLNKCVNCNEDKVAFNYNNHCQKSTSAIENCAKYSSDSVCEKCDESISYLANNRCVLGSVAKCIQYDPTSNKCLKCDTDLLTTTAFIPDTDQVNNSCVMTNPNYHHNCFKVNEDNKRKCDMCVENYYPKINDFQMTRYCASVEYYEFSQSANLTNCGTFDKQNLKCKTCLKDEFGKFFYNLDGTCSTSCSENQSVQVYKVSDDQNNIDKRFSCETTPILDTDKFSPKYGISCHMFQNEHNLDKMVCSGCKEDEVSVLDWDMNQNSSHMFAYLLTTGTESSFSIFNRITNTSHCLKRDYALTTGAEGTSLTQAYNSTSSEQPNVDNCRFIAETNDEVYQCVGCNFGYTGIVTRTLDNYSYMLDKCEILPDCKSDIFYDGLGSLDGQMNNSSYPIPIDFYVSCHQCEYTNNRIIPTYGIVAVSDIEVISPPAKLRRIAPFGIPSFSDPTQRPYEVEEINLTYQTTCRVPGLNQVEAFPINCGVQELQVDKPLNPYLNLSIDNNTNPICVACSPGYHPTQDQVNKKAIVKCEEITNCSNSTIFNKCSSCISGFAIKDGSNFTECVSSPIRNCWIYSENLSVCIQCLDGYVPINGNCDFSDMFRCKENAKAFSGTSSLIETLTLAPFGYGCDSCETGYVASEFNESINICIRSDALVNNVDHDKNNWIISDCKHYYLNNSNNIICLICQSGFIIQENKEKCHSLQTLPNCEIAANGGTTCMLCDPNYYYDTDLNVCTPGNIPFCLYYKSQIECSICQENYFASKISNSRVICFEQDSLNCSDLDYSFAREGTLSCSLCQTPYFLRTDSGIANFPVKTCLSIPPIENCVEYAKSELVTQSTLFCNKCIDSHYVDVENNSCRSRIYIISTCKTYDAFNDGCAECISGMYLAPSAKECIIYPTAIIGCIEFSASDVCTKCGEGRYLEDNQCIQVLEEFKIQDCRYYKNSKECLECIPAYFLENNTCTQAYASNCLTYVNAKECQTCKQGYGLSTLSNITSCTFIQVSNCLLPDSTSIGPNFKCSICSPDFYPDENRACQLVKEKLNNCKLYISETECMQCHYGYILSDKSCIESYLVVEYADSNCESNVLNRKCVACQDGYYFSYDSQGIRKCIECQDDTNCQICNPNDPTKCLMCKPGTTMNKDQTCGGGPFVPKEEDNTESSVDEGTDTNETDKDNSELLIVSTKIKMTITILVFLFVL